MSAVAVDYDPLRDKSYQATRLGRSVVDFLAWMELGGAADRTLDQYERDLARGALLFPSKGIQDLTDGDALQIARLFKPAERRVRIAAWMSFYKWARKSRQVERNPFDALPILKQQPQRVIDVFSDEEIGVLTSLPVIDGALMQILFDTGIRKGEARRLRLAHYRTHSGEFAILGGKGDKDRVVPAMTGTVAKLNDLVLTEGLNGPDHLWYRRLGGPTGTTRILRDRPMTESSFHGWWVRCLAEAGVRYRNPHTTRHTMATRYLRHGGRLERLSKMLGHSSEAITADLYAHLETGDIAADLRIIEKSIGSAD